MSLPISVPPVLQWEQPIVLISLSIYPPTPGWRPTGIILSEVISLEKTHDLSSSSKSEVQKVADGVGRKMFLMLER